ncbi:MAG TPA: TadE/TadG family type IV pilus assembly protein [Gemmataceae bacterium]|nr:TadE/TadG family type IV pilus assembly protein [Gemmataceae bacterium]
MRRHFCNDGGQAPLVGAWFPECPTSKVRRHGVAAVEFACCLPVIVVALLGVWEVGRIAQVSNVMSNAAREAARDASLGQTDFPTIASNLLTYLQSALPTAFGQGHTTALRSPTITLPANTTGYTYWDNTANQELFTITFTDITQPSITDPMSMQKLDHYQIGIQVPYSTIGWTTLTQITGVSRLSVAVDWACLRDAPFQVSPVLPAQ